MKIVRLNQTTSTNDFVKKYIKCKKDTLVIALSQSQGRGTKGRVFSSSKGGIYLSRLKFYQNLPASEGFSIVRDVSLAVIKTLLAFNIKAQIKWPNDILVGDKKICGILTENVVENGFITQSIVGVGLNVENQLDSQLKNIAVTMAELNEKVDFESVLMTLIFNLSSVSTFDDYKRFSCVLGKKVTIIEGQTEYGDTVDDILDDGRIKLSSGKILSSAEIKLKL